MIRVTPFQVGRAKAVRTTIVAQTKTVLSVMNVVMALIPKHGLNVLCVMIMTFVGSVVPVALTKCTTI